MRRPENRTQFAKVCCDGAASSPLGRVEEAGSFVRIKTPSPTHPPLRVVGGEHGRLREGRNHSKRRTFCRENSSSLALSKVYCFDSLFG